MSNGQEKEERMLRIRHCEDCFVVASSTWSDCAFRCDNDPLLPNDCPLEPISPSQAEYEATRKNLIEAMTLFERAEKEYDALKAKLDEMNSRFDDAVKWRNKAQAELSDTKAKLDAAEDSILVWQTKYDEVRTDNIKNSAELSELKKNVPPDPCLEAEIALDTALIYMEEPDAKLTQDAIELRDRFFDVARKHLNAPPKDWKPMCLHGYDSCGGLMTDVGLIQSCAGCRWLHASAPRPQKTYVDIAAEETMAERRKKKNDSEGVK